MLLVLLFVNLSYTVLMLYNYNTFSRPDEVVGHGSETLEVVGRGGETQLQVDAN